MTAAAAEIDQHVGQGGRQGLLQRGVTPRLAREGGVNPDHHLHVRRGPDRGDHGLSHAAGRAGDHDPEHRRRLPDRYLRIARLLLDAPRPEGRGAPAPARAGPGPCRAPGSARPWPLD